MHMFYPPFSDRIILPQVARIRIRQHRLDIEGIAASQRDNDHRDEVLGHSLSSRVYGESFR